MNERESLDLIRDMIDRTKSNLRQQSSFYLIWGWVVLLATLTEYVLLLWFSDFQHHYVVWPIAVLIGIASTLFMASKMSESKKVTTYADRALTYFWSSWSFFLALLLVYAAIGGMSWAHAYALIIALYGMGATVSGGILKFKTLVYGGIFSSLLAVLALFFGFAESFSTMLLFLAISIAVSYLLPGYRLRKS